MVVFKFPHVSITEGAANLTIPDMSQYRVPTEAPVFYNFLMEMNRDITILAIKSYQESHPSPLQILLPLAATGVRGIRIALEIETPHQIIMNDVSSTAYALMQHNVQLNHLEDRIKLRNTDALSFLNEYAKRGMRADIIDIDPFGTPVPFIDSSIRALKKRSGLICLTATDMAPLCGVNIQACLRKYSGRPLRTEYCHELAIRLCLNTLITTAARYEISATPIFCYSSDHYIRIYAELQAGALKADALLHQIGYIVHCFQCNYRAPALNLLAINPHCPACGTPLDYAGPLWLGALFNPTFCQKMQQFNDQMELSTKKRIKTLLAFIMEENRGPITYYNIHRLCKQYKINACPLAPLLRALKDQGYFASRTHFSRIAIRTDASHSKIAQLIEEYNKRI
ncbi:MAG: tRNA (guanine(10)-N(2))-dimethyltransferase [Candidatus Helarchaeota archaeon]